MNQGAEPSPAGPLNVAARDLFYLNARQIRLGETCTGSKCSSCWTLIEGRSLVRLPPSGPLSIGRRLARPSHFGTALVSLQDPLLPQAHVLFDVERQYVRVPPGHCMGAYARPVEARPDASSGRLHPLWPAVDNALLAKSGRSWNGLGLGSRVVGRIQSRVENLQPTASAWSPQAGTTRRSRARVAAT